MLMALRRTWARGKARGTVVMAVPSMGARSHGNQVLLTGVRRHGVLLLGDDGDDRGPGQKVGLASLAALEFALAAAPRTYPSLRMKSKRRW